MAKLQVMTSDGTWRAVEPATGEFIVAEISKNWRDGATANGDFLQKEFENIIAVNLERGYLLHSFQLHRLMTTADSMNETIIAVFRRKEAS